MAKGNTSDQDAPRVASSIPVPRSRRGAKSFFRDVGLELKKVNWPSKSETNRLTMVVLAVCGLMAILLLGLGVVADTFVKLVTTGRVG